MKNYLLEVVVFICGADLMILEIVGSRVLAPYLGTSLFVWTSLIGVILGCLSLGYWQGGRLADRNPSLKILASIIFSAAVFIVLVSFLKEVLLTSLSGGLPDLRLAASVATLILFGPASLLLGMVLPFASKLRIKDVEKTGSAVGILYAISTVGSIAGTFSAGFFLIAFLGNTRILQLLALSLILSSFLAFAGSWRSARTVIMVILAVTFPLWRYRPIQEVVDVDTNYSRVWIFDYLDRETNSPARMMTINRENSSAAFLDRPDLVFEYTKFYRLVKHFYPGVKNALMIGGGAYSYPKDFLALFPRSRMDVVEIDPQITELAKEYFGLKDDPRLAIFHVDGRTFLNQNRKKYEALFIDAYKSETIPHHLATKEAVEKMYEALSPDGVLLANLISNLGSGGEFLRAEAATYKAVFPRVLILPVRESVAGETQNIILVAIKSNREPLLRSPDPELNGYLKHLWAEKIAEEAPILTDDFAPVEYYSALLNRF